MTKVSPLYSQAPSNNSMLMATKMDKIRLECSRQVKGISSGFSTTLKPKQAILFVLHKALSMVKKCLLLNIQAIILDPQSTQELL
jgi:GTP-binding protein EngB required for normal cell division